MKMKQSIFKTVSAGELLFDGYSDPLLTMGSYFAKSNGIPMDKFGWFYKRNGTTWSDGVITMNTGSDNFENLGDIEMWNGENRTLYNGECGQLRGSAAGFLHPDPEREFIDFFSTDICRPIRFNSDRKIFSL